MLWGNEEENRKQHGTRGKNISTIKEISEKIEDKKEYYAKISDKIWEYGAEIARIKELKKEGFSIKSNLAGEETAFIVEYGSGKLVMGFLANLMLLPGPRRKQILPRESARRKTSDSKYESVPEREKETKSRFRSHR